MKKLTSKLLEEKLKVGWGISQFATELNMSEEEFLRTLNKTFDGPAAQIYRRRLKKNSKKIEQQLRRRAVCSTKKAKLFGKGEFLESIEDDETDETYEKEDSLLEKYIHEEAQLQELINRVEEKHNKEVANQRYALEVIKVYEERIENLYKLNKEIDETLERLDKERRELTCNLTIVQGIIAELRKVVILVDDDEFDIDPPEYSVSDEGWKRIRNKLIEDERVKQCTIIELSILAKAILLKKNISADGRLSSFDFSSDNLKKLFDELPDDLTFCDL